MNSRRGYRMGARADAAAETGERIIDAALQVFLDSPTGEFALDEVAARAGVSVRTVIRRFGGKDGLNAAVVARETARVRQDREVTTGDVSEAVGVLVAHYEAMGDQVMALLRLPDRGEVATAVAAGRAVHREWCETTFAPALQRRSGAERAVLLAQLVAVCDLQTWWSLRHDSGLDRNRTTQALIDLLTPLLEAP